MEGIVLAHPESLKMLNDSYHCLVRADAKKPGKVAIATGGGSGHLPVFLGYVGYGLADGVTVGNVFASPSAEAMYEVDKAIDNLSLIHISMFAAGRAFEQIRNSVAYPKLNVKIAVTHAGITVGEDGGSHQAIEDISLMRSIPNMVVLNPADDAEAKQAVKAAAEYYGPVYIRLGRAATVSYTHLERFWRL